MNSPYNTAMGVALDAARDAASLGDIPVGAVVVDASGNVLAVGRNYREERSDPFSHAEIEAMRAVAGARGTWNLEDCTHVGFQPEVIGGVREEECAAVLTEFFAARRR